MLLLTITILGFHANSTWENFPFIALLHTHLVDENGAMKLQRWPDKIICSLIFCFIFGAVLAAEEESRSSYIVAQENNRLHGYAVKRIDSTDEMSCTICSQDQWFVISTATVSNQVHQVKRGSHFHDMLNLWRTGAQFDGFLVFLKDAGILFHNLGPAIENLRSP